MPPKGKIFLAFAGIFVAGAVAGGVVALRVGVERLEQARAGGGAQRPAAPRVITVEQYPPQQLERYVKQLGLTAEQSGKITPLIEQATKKLDTLIKQNRADTLAIREDLDKDVSDLLTDDQRKKLAEMQKNRREQFDRMNRPPSFNPGGFGPRRGPPNGTGRGPQPQWRNGAPGGTPPAAAGSPAPVPAEKSPAN